MNKQLISLMRRKTDGDWEFLATAAGEESSVERTVRGLEGSSLLARGLSTRATVRRRVEALAAFDVLELVAVAKSWPRPEDFPSNGASGKAAGLLEAWAAALRFLPQPVQRLALSGSIPVSWREEKAALLDPAPRFRDWVSVIRHVENATSYGQLRATDRSTFPRFAPSEHWLDTLIDVPHGGRWNALQCVRVLRRCLDRLNESTRTYLLELATAAWATFSGDSAIQLLLFELAREVDPEAEVLQIAQKQLEEALQGDSEPSKLLQTAYVVSGTGWTMP